MSADAVNVWSDLSVLVEVGLRRGVYAEAMSDLGPGPNYQTFELCRGMNRVPRDIIEAWLRKNRRYLDCVKKGRIRIVESEPASAAA